MASEPRFEVRFEQLVLVALTLALGCGPQAGTGEAAGTASTAGTGETSTSAGTTTNTNTDTESGGGFLPTDTGSCCGGEDDEFGVHCTYSCNMYAQDCPEGEKCVPYSVSGVRLDLHKCVPVLGEAPSGESCTLDDLFESTDDCDADSYCFASSAGPGYCRSFCAGDPNDPQCAAGTACSDPPEHEDYALCLPTCAFGELEPGCSSGEGCYLAPWVGELLCMPAGPGQPGEACVIVQDCAPEHLCLVEAAVPGCVDAQCCAPLCEVGGDASECLALPGSECVPVFDDPVEPPLETLGVCVDPGF